jgi:hypothetical protein
MSFDNIATGVIITLIMALLYAPSKKNPKDDGPVIILNFGKVALKPAPSRAGRPD